MTYDDDVQEWVMSTGKRFYAFSETLGLSPDGALSYGADGGVLDDFTIEERVEIAQELMTRCLTWVKPGRE